MSVRNLAVRLSACVVLFAAMAPFVSAQNDPTAAPAAKGSQKSSKDRSSKQAQAPDLTQASEFSDAVANAVLGQIREGLEAHNAGILLAAFDRGKFAGYLAFEDQVQSYFEKYATFRMRFRILQTSVEGEKGVVLAEFDVEGMSAAGGGAMRRSNQVRFEVAKGSRGWKVVDMRPRGFFS